MINSLDPYDIPSSDCIYKGIRRGKIFWDFIDVKEHAKKMIEKEVIKNPQKLIKCLKEIQPLFKK